MRAFHFLPSKYALQALGNQRLKVARLTELNDPFELFAADLTDATVRCRFRKWKNGIAERIGLLCFSQHWRSTLLWSHYADRHRGIALECEIADDVVVPVQYRSRRVPLDVNKIMAGGGFNADLAENLAATKAKDWAYEEEVRVPIELSKCVVDGSLHFEEFGDELIVVGIVLGSLCKVTIAEIERLLPHDHEIVVNKSRLAFGSFSVVSNKAFPKKVVRGAA